MRADQADHGKQKQRLLHGSCRALRKGRRMMGDERANPAHIRLKFLDEFQIGGETVVCLVRGADHEAAAHLIADLTQIAQAAHAVFERLHRRVKLA